MSKLARNDLKWKVNLNLDKVVIYSKRIGQYNIKSLRFIRFIN